METASDFMLFFTEVAVRRLTLTEDDPDVDFMSARRTLLEVANNIASLFVASVKENPDLMMPGADSEALMKSVLDGGGAVPLVNYFGVALMNHANQIYVTTGDTYLVDKYVPLLLLGIHLEQVRCFEVRARARVRVRIRVRVRVRERTLSM